MHPYACQACGAFHIGSVIGKANGARRARTKPQRLPRGRALQEV